MPAANFRSGNRLGLKITPVRRIMTGVVCLLLVIFSNVPDISPLGVATAAPVVKPDPATATFTAVLKEMLNQRLLDCTVTVYTNEPKKKVVQVKVLTKDTGVARDNEVNCEYESGYIFRKIFNSKIPVKMAAISFYLPSKKMAYKIVVYEQNVQAINWDRVNSIDFGSLAQYVWPLPEGACTGFGQL